MNYLVIVVSLIAIVLVFLAKIYDFSMIYPTLLIVLAVILDVLVNTINERKNRKIDKNLDEIKNGKQK